MAHVEEVLHPPLGRRWAGLGARVGAGGLVRLVLLQLLGRSLDHLLDGRRVDQEEEVLLPRLRFRMVWSEHRVEDRLGLSVEVGGLGHGARLQKVGRDLAEVPRGMDHPLKFGVHRLALVPLLQLGSPQLLLQLHRAVE